MFSFYSTNCGTCSVSEKNETTVAYCVLLNANAEHLPHPPHFKHQEKKETKRTAINHVLTFDWCQLLQNKGAKCEETDGMRSSSEFNDYQGARL